MAGIFEFQGYRPVVSESAFVHPAATVIGNVIVGAKVYIGPSAVLRGDWGRIEIEDGCNVQENCTIHMFPGVSVCLRAGAHIGHGAVVHGAEVGARALVGMNAVLMDDVEIGEDCIVGALAFVPAEMKVPAGSLVTGNPASVVKQLSPEMIAWKNQGTALYQKLPGECHQSLKRCEPLREIPSEQRDQPRSYPTWPEYKRGLDSKHKNSE